MLTPKRILLRVGQKCSYLGVRFGNYLGNYSSLHCRQRADLHFLALHTVVDRAPPYVVLTETILLIRESLVKRLWALAYGHLLRPVHFHLEVICQPIIPLRLSNIKSQTAFVILAAPNHLGRAKDSILDIFQALANIYLSAPRHFRKDQLPITVLQIL